MRSDPATEVIDVQVTDDVEAGEPFTSAPTPPWRPVLGALLALVLVVGGAFSARRHATRSSSRPAAVDQRVVDSARAALDAWGRFGTTGDLNIVDSYFDRGGPQFKRLADESRTIASHAPGPPPYTFTMSAAQVLPGATPREGIVRADVVASRANESDQQFQWDLVLRRGQENRWLLWTVRDRQSRPSAGGGALPTR